MGFLGSIFNDVVDIVSAPIKIVTSVVDSVIETEMTDYIDETKEIIKTKND